MAVIAAIVGSATACAASSNSNATLLQDNAYEACKTFVNKQLRSPASASYPNYFTNTNDLTVTVNGVGAFTITSQVDSKNSFGVKIRTYFVCKTSTPDTGEHWTNNGTTLTPAQRDM